MPPSDTQRTFGLVIRQARERRQISQEALAAEAGLHRTYISLLERGQRNPSLSVILQLAAALKVSSPELLTAFESERRGASLK